MIADDGASRHGQLTPWAGYLTMTVWWVVPLILGAYLIKRRDA